MACWALPPAQRHERQDLWQGWWSRQRALRAQRRSIGEVITPKAPITIGWPMALTNQGCKRPCPSITSGCCYRASLATRAYASGLICLGVSEGSLRWFCRPPNPLPGHVTLPIHGSATRAAVREARARPRCGRLVRRARPVIGPGLRWCPAPSSPCSTRDHRGAWTHSGQNTAPLPGHREPHRHHSGACNRPLCQA